MQAGAGLEKNHGGCQVSSCRARYVNSIVTNQSCSTTFQTKPSRFICRMDSRKSQTCRVNSWFSVREGDATPPHTPVALPLNARCQLHQDFECLCIRVTALFVHQLSHYRHSIYCSAYALFHFRISYWWSTTTTRLKYILLIFRRRYTFDKKRVV